MRAGDFVYVAGMRGIDPATNTLVEGDEARVRQAFLNMQTIVEAAGGGLRDAVRLVVYVIDMDRYRPLGEQNPGGTLGRRTISAAHHRGGQPAQPGRRGRGRGNFLLSGEKSVDEDVELSAFALLISKTPRFHPIKVSTCLVEIGDIRLIVIKTGPLTKY